VKIEYPPGATPLESGELEALIPDLATQGQLNEFEAQNIVNSERWARGNSRFRGDLLSVAGLRRLHERMFGDTWNWAGRFRQSNKNIGIEWQYIAEKVQALCGDAAFWVENETWPSPELAVRFHHRLVQIHPFVNGNGRHARLAANLFLEYKGESRLPWSGVSLIEKGRLRSDYISALRRADQGNLDSLMEFAQSE
jgi:Fic-DOC domain mobile mystery protein B